MASGPEAGLAAIDALDTSILASYRYLPAARADLLRQLGRRDEAATEYQAALALADNDSEQAFLRRRIGEVTS
jgi:RNA polymerase sigma-70 factor (ECF subfamily)